MRYTLNKYIVSHRYYSKANYIHIFLNCCDIIWCGYTIKCKRKTYSHELLIKLFQSDVIDWVTDVDN